MIKIWIHKAIGFLEHSLKPIPQELNELDWKEELSPNNKKLSGHISAFANQPGGGFLVFGIENKSGTVKGVNQADAEVIVQKLSGICRESVNPVVAIDHAIELYDGRPLLFVYIKESAIKPVHIASGTLEDAYIRSGGTTRKASRQEVGSLMLNSKTPQYEELHASKLKSGAEILDALDYRTIYKLLDKPIPQNQEEIVKWLENEKMIQVIDGAGNYITNFGALAAAQNLKDFDSLARKCIRLIKYKGKNKSETEKEYPGSKGYAIGFEGLIEFVKALLPGSEIIKNALRKETVVYPEIALRELIANALLWKPLHKTAYVN
jgi:predicted HTH transcriptional regulator